MNTKPFLPTSRGELQAGRARDFTSALMMLATSNGWSSAIARAEQTNPRLVPIIRGAVPALSSGDDAALQSFISAATGWVQSLNTLGVYDRMAGDFVPAVMGQRFGVSTTSILASEVAPGHGVPIAHLAIDGTQPLEPRLLSTIVVATSELLRMSNAEALINREMQAGVVAGIDNVFLTDMIAATTPISSSNDPVPDIEALLAAVDMGQTSKPYFVFGVDNAKALAAVRDGNILLFPQMGIKGGTISGVPTLVSDQLSTQALLIDAASIAAVPSELTVDVSTETSLQLSDAPTIATRSGSPVAPVAANMSSLFQDNATAFKCNRYFAYRVLRDHAVASLSSVSYG